MLGKECLAVSLSQWYQQVKAMPSMLGGRRPYIVVALQRAVLAGIPFSVLRTYEVLALVCHL